MILAHYHITHYHIYIYMYIYIYLIDFIVNIVVIFEDRIYIYSNKRNIDNDKVTIYINIIITSTNTTSIDDIM